jgi:hypothetical protein
MSMSGDEQQQLIRRIGRALLGAAPPSWQQIRAEYRSAGLHIEADVIITGDDGQPQPVRPPKEVVDLLGELRAAMYQAGRGTWLSGMYLLEYPSKYSAEFEPDVEPRWRRVPPPIGFQDELRRFPREDAYIPDWLRARAGLPPVGQQAGQHATGLQPPAQPAAAQHAGAQHTVGQHAQQPASQQAFGQQAMSTPPGGTPMPPAPPAGA